MSAPAAVSALNPNASPKFQDLLLEPADNARLALLCGNRDEHLRQIERRLGVEINNRGHQFRVIGEPHAVAVAVAVLEAIYRVTRNETLTPAQVYLFLQEAGARGRTLNNSFIILDEAQNTMVEQMKMLLTRIGFGSTAVVTGDVTQVDLPRNVQSGLRQVLQVLKDVEGISTTFFNARDVVRHPLVR